MVTTFVSAQPPTSQQPLTIKWIPDKKQRQDTLHKLKENGNPVLKTRNGIRNGRWIQRKRRVKMCSKKWVPSSTVRPAGTALPQWNEAGTNWPSSSQREMIFKQGLGCRSPPLTSTHSIGLMAFFFFTVSHSCLRQRLGRESQCHPSSSSLSITDPAPPRLQVFIPSLKSTKSTAQCSQPGAISSHLLYPLPQGTSGSTWRHFWLSPPGSATGIGPAILLNMLGCIRNRRSSSKCQEGCGGEHALPQGMNLGHMTAFHSPFLSQSL